MSEKVELYGRIFVRGDIRAVTGLHIGCGKEKLEIGGVDNSVVRDPLTNRPYIPGSSLKGKMRSLWEKMTGRKQNFLIGRIKGKEVRVHVCEELEAYQGCPVCPIYGVPGDKGSSNPTRLVVRDVLLSEAEADRLEDEAHTDLPYTEVKWEAAIDRVTSAAVPRPMERVPAGAVFNGFEAVFSVYEEDDLKRFVNVFEAMQLLEDDYLGGQGSRGSGKVRFEGMRLFCRNRNDYATEIPWKETPEENKVGVSDVLTRKDALLKWLKDNIKFEDYQPAQN
jgi:CRISPR-associated protein Csm3